MKGARRIVPSELPDAKPASVSTDVIEAVADHVRQSFSVKTRGDIQALVKKLDCDIKVVDSETRRVDVQGTLEVRGPRDWTVYLPQHTGPLQDRFTLAHELGHYILHAAMGARPLRAFRTFNSSESPSVAEREADAFAFALLTPRTEFERIAHGCKCDVGILATHFGVDVDAASIRIASLGLAKK